VLPHIRLPRIGLANLTGAIPRVTVSAMKPTNKGALGRITLKRKYERGWRKKWELLHIHHHFFD